ncbi:Chemotaxis protein CheW [Agrobacterium rosae]|uniref:Chemotaxis protein CheW n=1 Tax=Agrobacterium rosae TaxID=1972867 RepID=A0A1R3U2Y0_9HYPH|nr:Chemotaxis protein CheW [Agrobacterium rosae]
MNLRGSVIPIIDLANKLGMKSTEPTPRSAIVVAEVHCVTMGLVVDRVSDILTIPENLLQPVPEISISLGMRYADGIIGSDSLLMNSGRQLALVLQKESAPWFIRFAPLHSCLEALSSMRQLLLVTR